MLKAASRALCATRARGHWPDRPSTRLFRQRIGPQLEVRRQRLRALAAFDQPWRAVAVAAPQTPALPAGFRIVDAAVKPLGEEAGRKGTANRHNLAVLVQRAEPVIRLAVDIGMSSPRPN